MKLRTQSYLLEPLRESVDPMLGLRDLRKGLNRVLLGYLCTAAAVLGAAGIIWYLIVQTTGTSQARQTADDASVVIFTLALLLPLTGFASLVLVVRGKWLCLISAPEQHHAKWMMFLSMLCILAGPLLNWGTLLLKDDKPAGRGRPANSMSIARVQHEIEAYKQGLPELGTHAYVKLAGKGIGLLSGVFFVLFLRAMALSSGSWVRARLAELYLLFVAVLVAGVVVLIRNPSYLLERPQLLLGLGAGWLLALLWYFCLILSTSLSISFLLARRPPEPELVSAPRIMSFPPLE
jgi:hypothetical protein